MGFEPIISSSCSITTTKNAIVTHKKKEIANPFLFLLIGGVLVIGIRDLYGAIVLFYGNVMEALFGYHGDLMGIDIG